MNWKYRDNVIQVFGQWQRLSVDEEDDTRIEELSPAQTQLSTPPPPPYRYLAVRLITDATENIGTGNVYEEGSRSFLVNHRGQLSEVLDFGNLDYPADEFKSVLFLLDEGSINVKVLRRELV